MNSSPANANKAHSIIEQIEAHLAKVNELMKELKVEIEPEPEDPEFTKYINWCVEAMVQGQIKISRRFGGVKNVKGPSIEEQTDYAEKQRKRPDIMARFAEWKVLTKEIEEAERKSADARQRRIDLGDLPPVPAEVRIKTRMKQDKEKAKK